MPVDDVSPAVDERIDCRVVQVIGHQNVVDPVARPGAAQIGGEDPAPEIDRVSFDPPDVVVGDTVHHQRAEKADSLDARQGSSI